MAGYTITSIIPGSQHVRSGDTITINGSGFLSRLDDWSYGNQIGTLYVYVGNYDPSYNPNPSPGDYLKIAPIISKTDTEIKCKVPDFNNYGQTFELLIKIEYPGFFSNYSTFFGTGVKYGFPAAVITSVQQFVSIGENVNIKGSYLNYGYYSLRNNNGMVMDIFPLLTYNSNFTEANFIMPELPILSSQIGIRITSRFQMRYQGTLKYENPIINNITPSYGYASSSSKYSIYVNGKNLHYVSLARFGTELTAILNKSSDGKVLALNPPSITTGGDLKLTYYDNNANADKILTYSPGFTAILTPFIENFTPTSGVSGTIVEINGYNLVRGNNVWTVPTVLFNGVPAVVDTNFNTYEKIKVTAPASSTGKISLDNNLTGSHTSVENFTYLPVPITVTFNTRIIYGNPSITNIQYSRNGQPWTRLPRSLSIMSNDSMSYRAFFARGAGERNIEGTITSPMGTVTDLRTTNFTLTLFDQVSRGVGYNVEFSAAGTTNGQIV